MLIVLACGFDAGAQQSATPVDTSGSFVGLVVRKGTLVPIPNAIATVLATRKPLGGSNDSGYFVARGLPVGRLDVLVRVSGFLGVTKAIEIRAGVVDTIQFEMASAEPRRPRKRR
jgi:hypothetical protein